MWLLIRKVFSEAGFVTTAPNGLRRAWSTNRVHRQIMEHNSRHNTQRQITNDSSINFCQKKQGTGVQQKSAMFGQTRHLFVLFFLNKTFSLTRDQNKMGYLKRPDSAVIQSATIPVKGPIPHFPSKAAKTKQQSTEDNDVNLNISCWQRLLLFGWTRRPPFWKGRLFVFCLRVHVSQFRAHRNILSKAKARPYSRTLIIELLSSICQNQSEKGAKRSRTWLLDIFILLSDSWAPICLGNSILSLVIVARKKKYNIHFDLGEHLSLSGPSVCHHIYFLFPDLVQ